MGGHNSFKTDLALQHALPASSCLTLRRNVTDAWICTPSLVLQKAWAAVAPLWRRQSLCDFRSTMQGLPICLNPEMDTISNEIRRLGRFRGCDGLDDLWGTGPEDAIFIDVGSNIGACALPLLARTRQAGGPAWVISFEPNPVHMARLMRTRAALPDSLQARWVLLPFGLANAMESHDVFMQHDHTGNSILKQHRVKSAASQAEPTLVGQAFTLPLDQVLLGIRATQPMDLAEKMPSVHLMKIDTEGFELFALQGMRHLLHQRLIKCIRFEFSPRLLVVQGVKPHTVLEELLAAGYKIYYADDLTRPLHIAHLRYLGCCPDHVGAAWGERTDFELVARPAPGVLQNQKLGCGYASRKIWSEHKQDWLELGVAANVHDDAMYVRMRDAILQGHM